MLHAPVRDSKKRKSSSPALSSRESRQEFHPPLGSQWNNLHSTYGNQAVLRMLSGQAGAKFRCADGDCAEDEPQLHRDFLGVAVCNDATGVVDTKVYKEHCAGNCVAQHEATHAEDTALCCERFSLCMSNAPDLDGRNKCRRTWDDWFHRIDDWTECNAYNREGQCLTRLMNTQCRGGSTGTATEGCCANLQQQMDFVTGKISEHCPSAVPFGCPFTEDGHMIPGLVP